MKKLVLAIVLCWAAVSPALDFAATALVGDDEIIARFGAPFTKLEIEIGGQVNGILEETGSRLDDYEWEETFCGVYAQKSIGPLYAGGYYTITIDTTDKYSIAAAYLGVKAQIIPQLYAVAEYQCRVYNNLGPWGDNLAFAGLRWEFN